MSRAATSRPLAAAIASIAAASLLGACSGGTAPPAGEVPASGRDGAVGSGRQSTAEPPQAPSAETGLDLFRKGDLKGAEPHLAGALKQSPGDRRLLEALGAIYARTERYRQAEESLRAALSVDPSSAGANLGLAAVFIDTGRYDEALRFLDAVRRIDPGNLGALVKGALLEARLGHADAAEAAARQAIARRPDAAEPHYVLGLALLEKGSLDGAEAEMRRTRDLEPGHLGALSHLVTIAMRRGRRQEAEDLRQAYTETLGRRRIEDRVRGHRLKGVDAFNRGDYATALVEFQAIAREDPADAQVYLHLGSTYIELGKLHEGRGALQRCLASEPRNERALSELGRLEALAGRLDDAEAALRKAIAANPEYPDPHYFLAGVYMARGDTERSRAETERYEALRAKSRSAADLIAPGGEAGP